MLMDYSLSIGQYNLLQATVNVTLRCASHQMLCDRWMCTAVLHSAQGAEETEKSGDEVHGSKGDKYQLGEHHYMLCGSGLGIVAQPGLHQPQQGQLEQANSIMSDHYESRAFHAKHSGADAQTDWGRELPAVDSAPPIASNSPPGSPTSSSAWGSPDEAAVNSPADRLAHSDSPDWGSARGAFPNRPQFRAVPASPAARSPAWGSPLRASCSRSLRHVSPSKSPAWQSPGRAARHNLDWHSPFSPGSPAAPSATLPHGNIRFRTDQSQPTRWSRSPDYVHPFWNPPEFVSAPAARAADDSPDYSQPLKEAEDGLSEPAMSPRYLRSGGGMEEEDRQMYAESDHEQEDNRMAEIQQGRPSLLLFKLKEFCHDTNHQCVLVAQRCQSLSVNKACLGRHITAPSLKCYGSGFRVVGMVSEHSRCRSSSALLQVFTQPADSTQCARC